MLVFWGHRKVKEQDDARVEAVVKRVQAGKLGFIACTPPTGPSRSCDSCRSGRRRMRSKPLTPAEQAAAKWVFVNEAPYYKGVKAGAPLTPSVKRGRRHLHTDPAAVRLPGLPQRRRPGHVTTVKPAHPIAPACRPKWEHPADRKCMANPSTSGAG
ncbi:hypothetical protein EMGBS6_12450 [Opitutia bacterium]|nr:hypothetical protein EMGBS6_12450 [Opitutae bacterium]